MFILAAYLDNLWQRLNGEINFWTCFGLMGNLLFSSRFFVQWYVSEKRGESVIPVSFWYLSLVGSVITSVYAIHLGSVPYILGVLPPTFIYARNLYLIFRGKKAVRRAAAEAEEDNAPTDIHDHELALAGADELEKPPAPRK
jgi:lipid-A-disaccharide synthase-like uncharacterized protein